MLYPVPAGKFIYLRNHHPPVRTIPMRPIIYFYSTHVCILRFLRLISRSVNQTPLVSQFPVPLDDLGRGQDGISQRLTQPPEIAQVGTMAWHIIEGDAGCAFAVAQGAVAVVVDALRASATAAILLDAGAEELLVVRTVEEAFAARARYPDALLYGERGGLPPDGFDYGNSPLEAAHAAGRRVIFTTTTGAGRLVAVWGAAAVYLGTTLNATAVARTAARHGGVVVLIPAGLAGDPHFDAQEDRAAAVAIAMAADVEIAEGRAVYDVWRRRIEAEGLVALFARAPHAAKLRQVGREADIAYCAQVDITGAVPMGVARDAFGVWVRRA